MGVAGIPHHRVWSVGVAAPYRVWSDSTSCRCLRWNTTPSGTTETSVSISTIGERSPLRTWLAVQRVPRSIRCLQPRPGEQVIDRLEYVEDTKGNNGIEGRPAECLLREAGSAVVYLLQGRCW